MPSPTLSLRFGLLSSLIRTVDIHGCDGNLNVSTLFEPNLITIFVSKRIFDTDISMPVVGLLNCNLCLFRLAQTQSRDDLVDGSGHGGTWLFWNSRSI